MAALRIRTTITALTLITVMGCTPTQPTTTPPAPSPTCTPEAGGNPYPCTPYDHDQMIAKDKLYTEAEAVYRGFLSEEANIYQLGGVDKPTPNLLATATGPYLEDSMAIYRHLKQARLKVVAGEPRVVWVRRAPDQSIAGSVVALSSCRDSQEVLMSGPDGAVTHGRAVEETAYFVREGEVLKIRASRSKVVPKCNG